MPAELQVAVQGWMGTAQIKARQRGASPVVARIVSGMNAHFRTTKVRVNLTCCVIYIVMSVLLLVMDAALMLAR